MYFGEWVEIKHLWLIFPPYHLPVSAAWQFLLIPGPCLPRQDGGTSHAQMQFSLSSCFFAVSSQHSVYLILLSCQKEQELNKGKVHVALEFSISLCCKRNSPIPAGQLCLIVDPIPSALRKGKKEHFRQAPISPQWDHGNYCCLCPHLPLSFSPAETNGRHDQCSIDCLCQKADLKPQFKIQCKHHWPGVKQNTKITFTSIIWKHSLGS